MGMDFHAKGANFARQQLSEVEDIVKRIIAGVSATIAAQHDGTSVSDQHRVINFQGAGVAVSDDPAARRTNVYIPGGVSGSATTHVLSALAASTKAKSLWNGSSNDAPPTNWQTTAFNDTAWSAAVSNTEAAGYTAIIPGATHLWPSATGTNTVERALLRQRFTLPPGEVASATLTILGDSELIGVWINGTLIGTTGAIPWGSTPGSPSTAVSFSVSPSVFAVSPTVNVIAAEVENSLDPTIGGSLIFDIALVMNTVTTLGTVINKLGADVTLTTINTYYDGPSVSLTAGTWLLNGAITALDTAGAANFTAKLWDGTTSEASGEAQGPQAAACAQIALSAIVTISTTTTYKISVANATRGTSGLIKAAAPQNSAGNNASYITAVKIG